MEQKIDWYKPKVDWYKPVQMSGHGKDNLAEVLSVQAEGAWVTWGSKNTAYFFLNSGNSRWDSATIQTVENVPESKVYWAKIDDMGWITKDWAGNPTHKITITPGKLPQIEEIK